MESDAVPAPCVMCVAVSTPPARQALDDEGIVLTHPSPRAQAAVHRSRLRRGARLVIGDQLDMAADGAQGGGCNGTRRAWPQ